MSQRFADPKQSKLRKKKFKQAKLLQQIIRNDSKHQSATIANRKPIVGFDRKTISIALPGSVIANAQTLELRTLLAGQIARFCAIYKIDEVVVFDEECSLCQPVSEEPLRKNEDPTNIVLADNLFYLDDEYCQQYPNVFLAFVLCFMECPQYLRKQLYPKHPALSKTGLLPPLALPSHLLSLEDSLYREGVVLDGVSLDGEKHRTSTDQEVRCDLVNFGIHRPIPIAERLPPYTRITARMPCKGRIQKIVDGLDALQSQSSSAAVADNYDDHVTSDVKVKKHLRIDVTAEAMKRRVGKLTATVTNVQDVLTDGDVNYWGYKVRLVNGLSGALAVPQGAPPYDLVVGTSERGQNIDEMDFPEHKRLLIVFGGVKGLEHSLCTDPSFTTSDASAVFPFYVNICPNQGSRTIRTEEAIGLTLATARRQLLDR